MATIRDIAIILIAVFDLVLLALLIAIAFVAWKLLAMVRTELPPIFGAVRKTATTVEGTADFITTTAAMPLIRTISLVFAVSRFLQVLFARGHSTREGDA